MDVGVDEWMNEWVGDVRGKWIDGRVRDQRDGLEDGTAWKKDGKIRDGNQGEKSRKKRIKESKNFCSWAIVN